VDLFEFGRNFDAELKRLKLPQEAKLQEPEIESTLPPLMWQVEFFISFQDGLCIAIWESWDKFAGLQDSRRIQWSYHYGAAARDSSGRLLQSEPDSPVTIRIDTCGGKEHLHYLAREPHYSPSSVLGLDLESVDCWQFIKGVLRHRKTGKPVDQVFGFKIKEK
jgi:hypothetical protein